MTTKIARPIRREIEIDGEPFTVVITPQGVRLTRKRFRSGRVVTWKAILDGHVARDLAHDMARDGDDGRERALLEPHGQPVHAARSSSHSRSS